jgi:hypothetical protein
VKCCMVRWCILVMPLNRSLFLFPPPPSQCAPFAVSFLSFSFFLSFFPFVSPFPFPQILSLPHPPRAPSIAPARYPDVRKVGMVVGGGRERKTY